MNSKCYYTIIGKNWQKGFTSTKHIQTRFGKYFHNNVPTQINIQSWSHPLNHIRFHNNSMVQIPYNVNPCGGAFSILNWCDIMRMEYPLLMHQWNSSWVLSNEPHCSFINTDMIMDWQYGIGRPNATSLEKNKYCINSLQCMATKCELDKRGILLFPKVIHGCTHSEYISSRSQSGLLLNWGTQIIDLCGRVSLVGQPVNPEASVMEVLVTCFNIMSYRTDVRYLVFYIVSFQKWQSTNNIPNHYRQQSSANANLQYHSGMCVIDLEPLCRGQNPLALYYEPHEG